MWVTTPPEDRVLTVPLKLLEFENFDHEGSIKARGCRKRDCTAWDANQCPYVRFYS